MKAIPMKFASYKTAIVELKGGVNENVSSLELNAGELLECKNYMIAEGGYGGYISTKGYERFDGTITPSEVETLILTIQDSSLEVMSGDVITGGTSGATATAIADGTLFNGSYVDGDAEVVVQCNVSLTEFTIGESLSTLSGPIGTLRTRELLVGATDDYNVAIQSARNNVIEVPGEGIILGLHIFEGLSYAFRKKVGLAEVGLYVEDEINGWAEVDTSASPLVYSAGNHDFHFTNYNFNATSGSYSMYWCDGVNKARAYDGTTVTVIDNAGMDPNDKPINIIAHNFFLYLVYPGGSLQQSVTGEPNNWLGTSGATEYGLGDEITSIEVGVQSSLVVFLREGIRVLTGNSLDNITLESFSRLSGAIHHSTQRLLGTIFFLDDRGLTTMEAVQEYGNYSANSISQRFKQSLFKDNHRLTSTLVSRDLNQYRMYFDDRTCIYVSFEGKEFRGATLLEFPHAVNVAAQGEDENGKEMKIFASTLENGYVYKMDSGTSFDGEAITCRLTTPFYHYGTPRQWKAFRRATIEIFGDDNQTFNMKVDFEYNESGSPRTIWYSPTIYSVVGGAIYGESKWGIMKYGVGSTVTNRVPVYIKGVGTNMSYKLISNETYKGQHIIQNIITDFELNGRRT